MRRGSLAEPAPQRSDRSLRRSSGETRLLGVPSLADASAEASDGRTHRFLLKKNLALKKKEEDEEKREVMEQAKLDEEEEELLAVPPELRTRAQFARLRELLGGHSSSSQRRRKKRKKKKLPRGVLSRARARRRQRQCLLHGWSVFPLVDDWSQMLGWLVWTRRTVFNEMVAALAVGIGSGIFAWLVLRVMLLALCSLLLSSGPR